MHIEGGYDNYPNEWIWLIPIPPKPSCPQKSPIVTEPAKKVPSAPLPAKNRNDNRFQCYISYVAHDLSESDTKYISYRLKIDLNLPTLFSTDNGFDKIHFECTDVFAQSVSANRKAHRVTPTENTNLSVIFGWNDRHKVNFVKRDGVFLSYLVQNYFEHYLDCEVFAELYMQRRLVQYFTLFYVDTCLTLSDTLAPSLQKGRVYGYDKKHKETKYRVGVNEINPSRDLYSLNKKHIQDLVYKFKDSFMLFQSFDSRVCYANKSDGSSELLELLFSPSAAEVRLINLLWMELFIIQNQKHQGQCLSLSSCGNNLQYDLLERIRRVHILKNLNNNSEEIGDCISYDARILSFFDTYKSELLIQCCGHDAIMMEEEVLKRLMLHSFGSLNTPYYKILEVYLTFKCYLKDKVMMNNTAEAKTTTNYDKTCFFSAMHHFAHFAITSNYLSPTFHEFVAGSNVFRGVDIILGSYLFNYPQNKDELVNTCNLSKVKRLKVLRENLRTKKHLVSLFSSSVAKPLNVSDLGKRLQHKKLIDVGHLSLKFGLSHRNQMH